MSSIVDSETQLSHQNLVPFKMVGGWMDSWMDSWMDGMDR